ncbi:carboxyl-terminal processing protease [Candidatus Frackibacter sp. WG12]|nr:carboxyl-terminal processing protease [Candidatus Frackibacter sp. WG11]SEM97989.1 carboxyl-terminal processing protease [Candidatus Frackibacter sp. WG12]SFM04739.1 carboxyl-terminal processing protease [Candidatus Frackibacter sp. WG13]
MKLVLSGKVVKIMFKRKRSILGVLIVVMLILGAGTLGFFIRGVQANNHFLADKYPQKYKTFKNILSIVDQYYVEEVDLNKLLVGAIDGMLKTLDDPYTTYLSAKDYKGMQEDFEGEFGGIGIVVTMRDEQLTIVSPIDGTPGSKANLQAGDMIIKIDEDSTSGMSINKAVSLMKGKPGTEVELTIKRKKSNEEDEDVESEQLKSKVKQEDQQVSDSDYKTFKVSITRATIEIPYVKSEIKEGNIGYIRVVQFAKNVGKDVQKELKKFREKPVKAVILDLRNNPGGLLPEAIDVASNFIPNGPIVHIKQRNGKKETLLASTQIKPFDYPLVVLVNKGSASASEIVSGAVQDTNSGVLIGTKTFGKGVVQTVVPLSDGSALKLTTARYYTPKDRYINHKGIKPDIKVKYNPETEVDEQLRKAIEYLKEQIKQREEAFKSAS